MKRILLTAALLLLPSCATVSHQERIDANRQQWGTSGPPPDAGTMCGTYFAKTDKPEGGRWSRILWHINGHYTERPSPGVCR